MKNSPLYKKVVLCLVALLYVSYYFVSPFFHYHEEEHLNSEVIAFHSHLLDEAEEQKHASNSFHLLGGNYGHNHPTIIDSTIEHRAQRFSTLYQSALKYIKLISVEFQDEFVVTRYVDNSYCGKILKEKCAQFASNVSPPFLFVT